MKKLLLISSCAYVLCASAQVAQGGDMWRTRAFDATYNVVNERGQGTMRMASDGHGHALMQNKISHADATMIMDSEANSCINITELPNGKKMAMKMPMREDAFAASSAVDMKKRNAESLGAKIVDGHPCHGFRYDMAGSPHEDWIGDDIDMLVESKYTNRMGSSQIDLQSYSASAPPQTAFVVPADAQVMDMSNLSNMGNMMRMYNSK